MYHITMLAVPHLVKTKGNIVNVSSVTGVRSVSIIELWRDFQQCGILTSVDSDEPVQPPFKLEAPNSVQSVA